MASRTRSAAVGAVPAGSSERPRDVGDLDGRHRARVAEEDRDLDGVEHGVAGAMDVQRLERSRRVEHHRGDLARPARCVAAPGVVESMNAIVASELLGSGQEQRVVELGERVGEVGLGADGVAGGQVGGRRAEESTGALALSGVSCAARASSAADAARLPRLAGAVGGTLELGGDLVIGRSGCRGTMPRPPVRVTLRVARDGQRLVGSTPIGVRWRPGRRPSG